MPKTAAAGLLTVVLVGAALLLAWQAQNLAAEPAGNAVSTPTAVRPTVASLLAMSKQERKATLRSLTPQQRSGLWFETIQARQAARQGVSVDHLTHSKYEGASGHPVSVHPTGTRHRSPGTIVYDSGFPTIGFGGGAIIGNRFNTHTGVPVFASGTVSTISALVVPGPAQTSSSAGFVIEGPQTGGPGATHDAFAIFSSFTTATGVIDSLTFAGIGANYTGSSFLVLFGDFANSYIPVFGTGSTLGQGHHGIVGYTGGMGPNITGTFDFGGALNSYIRVTGNIVPVELMTFDAG